MHDWRLKIFAYLHDPPDKPFALGRRGGHAAWGQELAGMLADGPEPGWATIIQRADWLASGSDRSGMLPALPPSLDDLRHPLSGGRIDLSRFGEIGPEAEECARQALREEVEHLGVLRDDPASAFVGLWGLLPIHLRRRRGRHELGALWDLLPADTRMPNHPITAHQALVSALASILAVDNEAALLSFTVGPVQRFIAQARRTSDLWGGSMLLSLALLEAVRPIVEVAGPDHVIFPSLRRSALFLDWLLDRSGWSVRLQGVAATARPVGTGQGALPNRFLAVLPMSRVKGLALRCEEQVRGWWDEEAVDAGREIEALDPGMAGFADLARAQVHAFLSVTWSATPWPLAERVAVLGAEVDAACRRAAWARGGMLPATVRSFIEYGSRSREEQASATFRPNGGALYGACYNASDALMSSIKRTRPVATATEEGLKCSLCGERAVVPGAMAFRDQADLWGRLRTRLEQRGGLRRGEALCGVCWTKRRTGLHAKRVPSTAEIAASPFKLRVLESLDPLGPEVARLCEAVDHSEAWGRAHVVSALRHYKARGGLAARFASVEGELLLAHPREDRGPAEDEDITPGILGAAAALRQAARARCGITPARPYLAALVMDGDQMGRWLSGERQLPLAEYLSERARGHLQAAGAGEQLRMKWPMTPALHAAFSESCAVFSQHTAPRTLHEDGLPAFLVYAGGDDVLALTPIGCHDPDAPVEVATEVILRLRLRFSGHVRRERGGDIVDPASEAGWVLDPSEGLALAFGHRLTASAGLAIFHNRWPLGRALEEARRAEHFAKDDLGRDALAISILRRSGQITRTGLRFGDSRTAMRSLQRVAHEFAFGGLSPRFLGEVRQRLEGLHGGLEGERLIELASPLVMQAAADHFEGSNEALARLQSALSELAGAAVEKRDTVVSVARRDRRQLERWLDLVEVAVFLGRGEEP